MASKASHTETPHAATAQRRVLYVCHDGDTFGSQQSLLLMVRHARAAGVVPFVSLARDGPLVALLNDIPGVTVLWHRRLPWFKHDRRTVIQRIGDMLGLLWGAIPRTRTLVRHIRDHRIEMVHSNSVVSLEGALAARWAGVPHVWHIRECFMRASPKLIPTCGRRFTRAMIRGLSARVVCISRAVQSQFAPHCERAADQFPLIYNAIPAPDSPAGNSITEKPLCIGYVGRLSEGKRFHDLLSAIAPLRETGIRLIVAGKFVDAAYEQAIQQQVKTLQLSEVITFLGQAPDIAAMYRQLDVLVLPSLNEPFGRVLIEAMGHGVACVGADSGGIPEIITHQRTGWLYPPGDATALSAILRQLAENPALMVPIRAQAHAMVADRFYHRGANGPALWPVMPRFLRHL